MVEKTCRREDFLAFSPPAIGEEEVAAVTEALRSGWITAGPRVREFEQVFAERVGAPAALAVSSCTAALHLALCAHGIGPGDEVIVPTMTFAASANVVEHVGARPVLVDVDADTLNLSVEAVSRAITTHTRAVMVVHYAGHPVDLDGFRSLCNQHRVELIEDAAHAVASAWKGKPVGSGENMAAFSFYATKNLTTGEGGMLTGAPELIERVRPLALHGMSRDAWRRYNKGESWFYEIVEPGYKYNLTDPAAAMGLVQLAKLEAMQARREEVADIYDSAWSGSGLVRIPVVRKEVVSARHLYPVRLVIERLSINRNRFIEELSRRNIGTSVHFIPLHRHPYYRDRYGYHPQAFPVAEDAYRRLVSLPLHPGLSAGDVEDVVGAVNNVLERFAL